MFEKILSTNLINFIIVVLTLWLIYKKAHLGILIQKMADDIKNDVENSAQSAQNAIKEYKEAKKDLKGASIIQEEIIQKAKKSAQNIKEKIEEQTKIKEKELKEDLINTFKKQEDNAKKHTLSEIYSISIDLAREEIVSMLDDKMHKKLINQAIDEISKIEGNLT